MIDQSRMNFLLKRAAKYTSRGISKNDFQSKACFLDARRFSNRVYGTLCFDAEIGL
jgi:hypothetical protein